MALFASEYDPLQAYRSIARSLSRTHTLMNNILSNHCILILEIGFGHFEEVIFIFEQENCWDFICNVVDYNDIVRGAIFSLK